jgi:uncharacterized protein (DUF4415 family)
MSDDDRDLEMLEEYDFSQAKQGPVIPHRPGKTRITIRIDTDVLDWFREQVHKQGGGNYQTMINEALRTYAFLRRAMTQVSLEEAIRHVVRDEVRAELAQKGVE